MECTSTMDLGTISKLCTVSVLQQAVCEIYVKTRGTPPQDEISRFSVDFASGKGDGYIGVVYRVTVELRNGESVTLIGKGMPANLTRRKIFQCTEYFKKEVQFYSDIVPQFREFEICQRGLSAHREDPLLRIADCYYAVSDGENDFLLLEDLAADGYDMAQRTSGLNADQLKAMLVLLGRFHAISLAMKTVVPEKFSKTSSDVVETIFRTDQKPWIEDYYVFLANIVLKAASDELQGTDYLKKFQSFTDPKVFFDNMMKILNCDDPLGVICHGDAWSTNFMFKEAKAKAIDFQTTRYGSLIFDLSMMIFACTTEEQRVATGGVAGILEVYHCSLADALRSLRGGTVTLEEVKSAWHRCGLFGLGISCELVPMSLTEDEDLQDLDRVDSEMFTLLDTIQFQEIKSSEGKKRLADLIRMAVDEGLFELN